MNNQTNLSVGDLASALGGAGLTMINTDIIIAGSLIAAAVVLKVLVAVLQKQGVEIQSQPLG